MRLSIIIPVYNEVLTIAEVVRRARALDLNKEIILVDDGSTDGTTRVLDTLEGDDLQILRQERNQGKGAAIRVGLEHVTGDCVVIQDADLEYYPEELGRLLAYIERNEADVVYGSRFLGARRSFMFTHYVGNKILNLVTNLLYNVCLTDMETCYKVMRTSIAKSLQLESNGFDIEPEITAKVIVGGYRLVEAPISYVGRDYIDGKKISWIDGLKALWTLVKLRLIWKRRDKTLTHLESAYRYNEWVAEWIREDVGDDVIEIGAGLGSLSRRFFDRKSLHMVDLEDDHVAYMRDKFRHVPHASVGQLDVSDPSALASLEGRTFDTIIMSNVLEHIENDDQALLNCASLLRPGGKLVLIVPSHSFLFGTLDISVGHFRRYDEALQTKLETAGYRVARHRFHNWFGALGWFVQGRILRSEEIPQSSIRTFERLIPVVRILDSLIQPRFGQSMVMVGERL